MWPPNESEIRKYFLTVALRDTGPLPLLALYLTQSSRKTSEVNQHAMNISSDL